MKKDARKLLKRRLSLQDDIIRTLEEQVLVLSDVNKIKDLTIQALVGAVGANVEPDAITGVLDKPAKPGPYL